MNRGPRNFGLFAGAIITGCFIAIAVIARFWTPYDPAILSIVGKLQAPGAHHWFGTDQLGRDVLSMIMSGAQTSVGVALLSVAIGSFVGVPAGLLAAAHRGAIDELVMRGNDLIFAFPALLLAILITAVFGPGAVNAIIAIGIFNIPVFARVTRAGALQLWDRDYVLAARVAGKGPLRISRGVIAEAGLSYVGLSAQPPTISWGRMLNEAQSLTALAPYLALFPGFAVLLFVLGLNLLGDGLRQSLARKQ
jgi:peptide/nickel transport system permease protein